MKALAYLLMIGSLTACPPNDQSRKPTEQVRGDEVPTIQYPIDLSVPMPDQIIVPMKSACLASSVTEWRDEEKECRCKNAGDNLVFETSGYRCQRISFQGFTTLLKNPYFHFASNQLNVFPSKSFDTKNYRTLLPSLELSLMPPALFPAQSGSITNMYVNAAGESFGKPFEMVLLTLAENERHPPEKTNEFLPQLYTYFETKEANIPAALGSIPIDSNHSIFRLAPSDERAKDEILDLYMRGRYDLTNEHMKSLDLAIQDLERAYRVFQGNRMRTFEPTDGYTGSSVGCLFSCSLKAIERLNDLTITYVKKYIRGARAVHYLRVNRDARDELVGVIVLNPAGGISSIYPQVEMTDESHTTFLISHYDRDWNPIRTNSWDFQVKRPEIKKANLSPATKSARALICDSLTSAPTNDRMIVGPHHTKDPSQGGSYFGWFPNIRGRSDEYYSGMVKFSDIGTAVESNSPQSDHMNKVIQAFLDPNTNAQYAVMGYQECLDQPNQWKESIHQSGIRVINYSMSTYNDPKMCAHLGQDGFAETRSPFLWVIAAGNEGVHGRSQPNDCPANLPDSANRIVVAAVDVNRPDRLASVSNYGTDYADIAAPGNLPKDSAVIATSFAAPRVSRLAAEIAHENPNLPPEAIRWVILLSAKIPAMPLAVRSGGVMDWREALRLARQLSTLVSNHPDTTALLSYFQSTKLPAAAVTEFLHQTYCGTSGSLGRPSEDVVACNDLNRKMSILTKNGAVQ